MPELSSVNQLLRAHYETNDIRHKSFYPPRISVEFATQHFESFRLKSLRADIESAPMAFREGPAPELVFGSEPKGLLRQFESRFEVFSTLDP